MSVPGLDSVAYGLTTSFPIQHGEFVQTGKGHWVTASSIGVPYPAVHIYDSFRWYSPGITDCPSDSHATV